MPSTSKRCRSGGKHFERLENRALLSVGPIVQSSPPPVVIGVFVSGTEWTTPFKQSIEQSGMGYADLGAGATIFGSPKPWTNVNQITLRFSADMVVESRHLRVFGSNVAEYPIASFAYRVEPLNYTGLATWTLARPLPADKVLLRLDAHSQDGVRIAGTGSDVFLLDGDRDGQPGGDFLHRFNTVPGDMGSLRVDARDVAAVRLASGTSVTTPGRYPAQYHPYTDVNADGEIDVRDVAEVRRRIGTSLPFYEPTGSIAVQASTPLRTRPVSRTLFSSAAVLA